MLEAPLSVFDLKPSSLTRAFWDAAREGRLLVQECNACGKKFFRPEIACPHCRAQDWRWVESSGRGKVYSFSVLHRAPSPAFKAPFIFAAIELDEGWTMFSNLIGIEIDDAAIGMPVQVTFHKMSDELTVPLFRPAAP